MTTNDGGAAFPTTPGAEQFERQGMSLRDWFAGLAMQGLLAGQYRDNDKYNLSEIPEESCRIADCLLAKLSEGGE